MTKCCGVRRPKDIEWSGELPTAPPCDVKENTGPLTCVCVARRILSHPCAKCYVVEFEKHVTSCGTLEAVLLLLLLLSRGLLSHVGGGGRVSGVSPTRKKVRIGRGLFVWSEAVCFVRYFYGPKREQGVRQTGGFCFVCDTHASHAVVASFCIYFVCHGAG